MSRSTPPIPGACAALRPPATRRPKSTTSSGLLNGWSRGRPVTRRRTNDRTARQLINSLFALQLSLILVAGCSDERSLRVLGDGAARGARVMIDGTQAGQLPEIFPPNADPRMVANPCIDLKVAPGDHRVLVISAAGESLSCRTSRDTGIVLVSFAQHDISTICDRLVR